MAADKYLLEDGSGGYQLEDASGALILEVPEAGGWLTQPVMPVLRAAVAGAIVFAFVPPPQASASEGASTGQLSPRPTVQYQAGAGSMAPGLGVSWLPRLPDPVRPVSVPPCVLAQPVQALGISWIFTQPPNASRAVPSTPSIVAAPVTSPAAQGVNWIFPRQPDPVRLLTRSDSIFVQPPSVTASLPQNVTWWPQFPDRVVQRIRFQEPLTVGPPVSPTLPSAADAGIHGSGGQLYPRPVVQYQSIAGPVVVPTTGPIIPLQFNADGLIRPDSWTQNQAVAGPVAIPIPVGWWPRLPDTVQSPVRPVLSLYAQPIQPLNPAGLSTLPWLMRNAPLILPQYPVRQVLALNPTTPSAPLVHGWWLRQPDLVRLLRENPHVRAVPIQPLNPAGRSDLPWLPQAPPGKDKPIAAPSSLAFPPPAALLGSVAVATWIIIVPSWPDTVVVEACADVIIVPAFPNDVDVP